MTDILAVIDPTWPCETGGGKVKRGADRHYALARNNVELASHYGLITQDFFRDPAAHGLTGLSTDLARGLLWMWVTNSALIAGDAHELLRYMFPNRRRDGLSGRVRFCAKWTWVKVDQHCGVCGLDLSDPALPCCDNPAYRPPLKPGLGQWSRVEDEVLLLARIGDVKVPEPAHRLRTVIYAPRGRHSEKPEAAWRVIETVSRAVLPGVVGTEFNARVQRPGWNAVGHLDGEDKALRIVRTDQTEGEKYAR